MKELKRLKLRDCIIRLSNVLEHPKLLRTDLIVVAHESKLQFNSFNPIKMRIILRLIDQRKLKQNELSFAFSATTLPN